MTFGRGGRAAALAGSRPRCDDRPAEARCVVVEGDADLNGDGFSVESHTASDGYRWALPALRPLEKGVRNLFRRGKGSGHLFRPGGPRRLHPRHPEPRRLVRPLSPAGWPRPASTSPSSTAAAPASTKSPAAETRWVSAALRDVAGMEEKKQQAAKRTFVAISWGGKTAVGVENTIRRWSWNRPALSGIPAVVAAADSGEMAVAGRRLTRPTRTFPVPLSDPTLFTATEKCLTFLRDDPPFSRRATARFLFSSVMLDRYLRMQSAGATAGVAAAGRPRPHHRQRPNAPFRGPVRCGRRKSSGTLLHHTPEFEPDRNGTYGTWWDGLAAVRRTARRRSVIADPLPVLIQPDDPRPVAGEVTLQNQRHHAAPLDGSSWTGWPTRRACTTRTIASPSWRTTSGPVVRRVHDAGIRRRHPELLQRKLPPPAADKTHPFARPSGWLLKTASSSSRFRWSGR